MARKNKRDHNRTLIHSSSIISISLCIISIGLLVATCLNSYFVSKQSSKLMMELDGRMLQFLSNDYYTDEKNLEDVYLSYYNQIDQKATDSINVALSFFGFIFSLTTIVNTIIAVRVPKQFEDSLHSIDDRIQDIERRTKESITAARYLDSVTSKKTLREKIDAITDVIEEYGHNSGEFYFARGFLYDDIKEYDNAKADYVRAKKAGGSRYTYYNSLGVLYSNIMSDATNIKEKKHAFNQSEINYKNAIKLIEQQGEKERGEFCHCNLACLYQDYAKALKGWSMLEKIKHNEENCDKYTAEYKRYFQLALDEFDKAIYLNDDYLIAYLNRGISYTEMGEDFYLNAYMDFQRCFEIDSDNELSLKLLSETSIKLFQKTNDEEYYRVARNCITKLRQDTNSLELLQRKIDAIDSYISNKNIIDVNKIIAQIDEKLADISVAEAQKYSSNSVSYGISISDAIEHYKSSVDIYNELYSNSKNEEFMTAINRLKSKMAEVELSNQSPLECNDNNSKNTDESQ